MNTPFSLGRHVNHDPLSRNFQAPMAESWKPVKHRHYGPILNQGNVGSCTGNAMAQGLNTVPLHKKGARLLREADALALYRDATMLDPFPGYYPQEDTGSDGLSVAKAAQRAGYITSYRHAFGFDQARAALQLSPLLVGINWYEDMFTPNSKGVVVPGGQIAGGHEIVAVGDNGTHFEFINSWDRTWGKAGRFLLAYADFKRLLAEHGDVVVPVP